MAARDSNIYRKTNRVWNQYRFNKRENIGYSMELIKTCKPKTPDEWQQFYQKSGEEAYLLNKKKTFKSLAELKQYVQEVKCSHGKTKEDLLELAKVFQEKLKENKIDLDIETCFNYVYIRAVDEAFIGYQREMTAFELLDTFCKKNKLSLVDTDSFTDIKYGVDYEIYNGDKLIAGIQVKSSIYKKAVSSKVKLTDIENSDKLLKRINSKYTKDKMVPVLYAYISRHLSLENEKLYDDILQLNKREKNKSQER